MGLQRILIVAGGAVGMLILMLLRRKNYPEVKLWKYPVISVLLTIAGVAGAMLMHFIESGDFGGTSFFGAILFVPILLLPALLLRVPYGLLMDLCAPAECLMLAFMKVDCLVSGCCGGRYLPDLGIKFPSQIVELTVALLIMLGLVKLEQNRKNRNTLYGYYLLAYGSTRFVLNWFRYGLRPYVWILPPGNFWSLIAIALGAIWVIIDYRFSRKSKRS